jgi:hypothetical protein
MADEQVQETPAAEPEESLAEFVARENALERGDPEPEPTPEPEPESEPAATTSTTDTPKVDKRTKEGRKLTIQQEIDALTAAKHEAKRELEAHQAELARLRTQRPQSQQPQARTDPQPATAPPTDAEPTLNDFMKLADGQPNPDPYSSWVFAKAAWISRHEYGKIAQQTAAERHQASVAQTWGGKLAEIRQRVPDIDQRLSQTPIDQRVWPFLQNHPQGPDIAEYLSNNIPEAQALLRLHPIEQVGRIGEIVGRISARSAAAPVAQRKPPVVSAAKPPIQPLGTSPVAASPDPGDDEPLSAFIERENKAERSRRMR